MSINYGRSLPNGPRPKPPQPKLGEIGQLRGLTRAKRRRRKPKPTTTQAVTDNGSNDKKINAQTQKPAKKKNKKHKLERPKQNTPVKVEVVKLNVRPSITPNVQSSRVVVVWRGAGRRYIAWGKRNIKSVEGWSECTDDSTYYRLLKNLHPFEIKLSITDQRIPVVPILDLIIAAGKVLKPRQVFTSKGSTGSAVSQSRRGQPRTQSSPQRNQHSLQHIADDTEAARNEVLVIRPSQKKSAIAERGRNSSRETSHKEQKRKQLLAKQRRELSRLSWLRRNCIEERDAPDDMMHIALQGGSPGLKR